MYAEQQVESRRTIQKSLQQHKERHPFRVCLGCEVEPKFRYKDGAYGANSPDLGYPITPGTYFQAFNFYCPSCGFSCGSFMNLQAAINEWHRANTPGDPYYLTCWTDQYIKQTMEREMKAAIIVEG